MKSPEHDSQATLFTWANLQSGKYPDLKLMFAIPNESYGGTRRDMIRGRRLKAEGRKAGVPDIFLPIPKFSYNGLFIEMKSKKGRVSDRQKGWLGNLGDQGYRCEVCYSFEEAKQVILEYLNNE